MTYVPNPDEKWGYVLVSFSDGTLFMRDWGSGRWTSVAGPSS